VGTKSKIGRKPGLIVKRNPRTRSDEERGGNATSHRKMGEVKVGGVKRKKPWESGCLFCNFSITVSGVHLAGYVQPFRRM